MYFFRAQNHLIIQNMHTCFSVNSSYYFFGHNGTTAIEQVTENPSLLGLTANMLQETQTGLMTGLVDFILKNAPFAKALPDAKYDDYFR